MAEQAVSEPGEGEERRSWLRFSIGYLVILAVVVLFSVKFVQQSQRDEQRNIQLRQMQSQYASQVYQNQVLAAEIKTYRTLGFVRQQARAWGYVKPGDRLVLISYVRPHIRQIKPVIEHVAPSQPTWMQWWHALFGG